MQQIHPALITATTVLLLALAPAALAQQGAPAKKLYCWNENGRKVCGDALPATAVDSERTEFNAKSGLATGKVDRALNDQERAAAAALAAAAKEAQAAEEARIRRELAMVESYTSEAELRQAYGHRVELNKGSIQTAQMSVTGLRQSLVNLLRRASESELANKAVPKPLQNSIQQQHSELLRQQRLLGQLQAEAGKIQGELNQALTRYRELKSPTAEAAPATTGNG